MSEGLSKRDGFKAERLYHHHENDAYDLEQSKKKLEMTDDSGDTYLEHARARFDVRADQQAYDANLWQAHEHYRQNQEAYVEDAKRDAEAAGVEVNLPQAKE